MISQDLQQSIDRVEECADEAKRAVQTGQAPQQVKDSVDALHQQARQAKQSASSTADDSAMRDSVMQLESAADRAMQACRAAGNLDPQTQQAIQRAHDEASKLKKQVEASSPA